MGKIRVIEQYIKRHAKELENSIIEIQPKLIEAFVNIYGEKHRVFIENIIKNMKYIFFISEEYNYLFSRINRGISKKNTHIMKSYLKYLKENDYIFHSVAPEDEERFIIERYLPRYPFRIEDYSAFSSSIKTDCPCCSAALYENKQDIHSEFYICLPIFTIDLKTIIHEINHALNINIVGYTEEVLMMRCLFEKECVEELVNDYIATMVTKEFMNIGGVIPNPLKRIEIGNEYEYKDYIVTYLFECLEPLLLESRISSNYNLFYKLIGEENVRILERIMEELYNKDYFDEYLYNELLGFINEIYEKVITTEPTSTEDQIRELEKNGVHIRMLKKESTENASN